jgi:hypothetical protein
VKTLRGTFAGWCHICPDDLVAKVPSASRSTGTPQLSFTPSNSSSRSPPFNARKLPLAAKCDVKRSRWVMNASNAPAACVIVLKLTRRRLALCPLLSSLKRSNLTALTCKAFCNKTSLLHFLEVFFLCHEVHDDNWPQDEKSRTSNTVVFPKEGHMRFAGQTSRSLKFAIFWAADNRNKLFLDLEEYLRKLAFRVTWPSFGITTVSSLSSQSCCFIVGVQQ